MFETKDDEQVFVGVVSDKQWQDFCAGFELTEFANDSSLKGNSDRVKHKDRIIPEIQDIFRRYTKQELMDKLDRMGLPFAPITKPEDLFDDTHLNASAGLLPITVTDGDRAGKKTKLPALPLEMNGQRFGITRDVPQAGQHTREILRQAGHSDEQVEALIKTGIVMATKIAD